MDSRSFQDLLSPAGQEVLRAAEALAPREGDYLRHFQNLARRHPAPLARAALEIAILRDAAREKFPEAGRMYFTRESLEQASTYAVSAYRASRYQGCKQVVDLGCSVGGDTLAMTAIAPALGVDRDSLRLALARANLEALGLAGRARLVRADLASPLPLSPDPELGLFFDPARRAHGRRVFSVGDYRPPLAVVDAWLPSWPALGVKISPGVKLAELVGFAAELEFISLRGKLKEAVLWFGPLQTVRRRATLLPGPHTLAAGTPGSLAEKPPSPVLPVRDPQAYLYEPDPAVLRAGLVGDLGRRLGAAQLDPTIAYLTADTLNPTPFARVWVVEDWFPFGLKRLRAYLRARGVGRVVVKKRGSPLDPEALIQKLRLDGDLARVLFLTRLRGRPIVIVCEDE